MSSILLVIGLCLVAFAPYLYFKKVFNMKEKMYLLLVTIGAICLEVGLYYFEPRTIWVYILMAIVLLLFILAGIDAIKAFRGRLTKAEQIRLEQIRHAEEVKQAAEQKNAHYKI